MTDWQKEISKNELFNPDKSSESDAIYKALISESIETWKKKLPSRKKYLSDRIESKEFTIEQGLDFFIKDSRVNVEQALTMFSDFLENINPAVVWAMIMKRKEESYSFEILSFAEFFKSKLSPKTVDPNTVFETLLNCEKPMFFYEVFGPKDHMLETFTKCEGFDLDKWIQKLYDKFEGLNYEFWAFVSPVLNKVDKSKVLLRKIFENDPYKDFDKNLVDAGIIKPGSISYFDE